MSDGVGSGHPSLPHPCCRSLMPDATMPGKALAEFPHGVVGKLSAQASQGTDRCRAAGASVPEAPSRRLSPRAHTGKKLRFLDIVLAVDGSEPAFRCSEIRRRGPAAMPAKSYRTPCGINSAMLRAERAWRAELKATTLADTIKEYACIVQVSAQNRTAQWVKQNQRPAANA